MTATPKAVILAVVIFLGLIVLGVIAGTVALQLTDNGALPNDVGNLGLVALGALAGVLATTRTTPELPPGAVVTQGQTTITTPTTAQNEGETASGTPVATTQPIVVNLNDPAHPATQPIASTANFVGPALAALGTMDHVDPASIPGYSTPVPPAPPVTEAHQTEPVTAADAPR